TLPNGVEKLTKNYSGSRAPYFSENAVQYINGLGIMHLLTDLPSLDREDDALLKGHHAFFRPNGKWQLQKTVTEMIYAKEAIDDGLYWLDLQIAPFESDASPSRPVLYAAKFIPVPPEVLRTH
nr:cyclase family protein [Bacteroidota bacterium]